jgi:DNA-binding PadR family transcriptional regulator
VDKRRKVSNPLALAVLAELLMGPMHPYEMGRRLKEHGTDRSLKYNRGSLYMVVEQLGRAGFVVEQETVRDTQRPERTVYALTDAGRGEFYDWMRELVAEPRQEYPQFGVALSLLSVLSPVSAAELLSQRVVALTGEIDEIRATVRTATEGGLAWVFLVEEEYRLAVLEAECRFVTGLVESLRQPDHIRAWQEIFGSQT